METKSTEFFRNMKTLPPRGSDEFNQLRKWEEEKCLGGVTLNGVLIPGWLYFHINHWWIRKDKQDLYGNTVKFPSLPDLRDNEWIRGIAIEKCRVEKKGYMEVGLRQGGKSEFEASITAYNALLFRHTQNVIVGGNEYDLSLLKDKIDFGLKKMWEGLAIPRIDKDWRKPLVKLGYKDTNNEDDIWSYLVIRNAEEGRNTETAAGTTAKSFVLDECGKFLFGQVFEAAKPAFLSEFGWRTIPVLVGTGGSFERGADAERFFQNPDANNFLAFYDPETNKRTCLFMSGLYRQDCKNESNLSSYLQLMGELEEGTYPELEKVPIRVSDKEKALKMIEDERIEKAKDPDKTEYLKAIMYHPLTPDECFMSSSANIFNVAICKKQRNKLSEIDATGTYVDLHYDGENVFHEFSRKRPVSSYPAKAGEDKDAPVVIYEFPIENPPYGLYTAGVDPYRQGQARYSNSLGAVYIFKRMHSITGEGYQNMFVASYVARPEYKRDWEEQARLLIKYYNARTLCENDEISFIDYMINMGDAHYLEKQPDWLKDIVANTTVTREYGIHRSAEKIRDYLNNCLKHYAEELIKREKNEEGKILKEIYGIQRILDPILLEEMIKYNDDDNFDRVIAASLAIALANRLDPIIGKIGDNGNPIIESLFKKTNMKSSSIFGKPKRSGGLFSLKKKGLFK